MKILNIFSRRKKRNGYKLFHARAFSGGGTDRLLSSWTTSNTSLDYDLRSRLENLRARSRDLEQNNSYAKRYLDLCVSNICGPAGIKMQSKIKKNSGGYNKSANEEIEKAWNEWIKNCSVEGNLSWSEIQRICLRAVARDGEVLVKILRGVRHNKFNFALQIYEADYLDIKHDKTSDPRVVMGVEKDDEGRSVAYYIFKEHPGNDKYYDHSYKNKLRVPASNMIHLFVTQRPGQSRGYPWMHAGMTHLKHLSAYEEAEIVASRVGASKMGIITSPTGDEYTGEKDSDGNVQLEVQPGTFEQLPAGFDFKQWDPTHPAGNFEPFMKATLRGIASAFGVSYISLANDLKEANYSSMRAGSIEERDMWKLYQEWFINSFCYPIFREWMYSAYLAGQIRTSMDILNLEAYIKPVFFARSWDWVDPLKDSEAAIREVNNGLNTRTNVLAQKGYDIEDIIDTMKQEKEMLAEAGIKIPAGQFKKSNQNNQDEEDDDKNKDD